MQDIAKFDIATTVTDSLIEVFDTMLSMQLELSDDAASIAEVERIGGSVSLAGRVMGTVIFQVSEEFSRKMTAAMLGIELEEVEGGEDVKDVISEICNIVGGNLKSAFCDVGLTCRLSPPSFTTGSDFEIESLGTARHETHVFVYEKHPIIVKVGVRATAEGEVGQEGSEATDGPTVAIDLQQIEAFDIRNPVNDAMVEVFDMMLSMDLEVSDQDLKGTLDGRRIVGSVSFIGPLMGSINIQVSRDFSRQMTAAMLDVSEEEADDENQVRDVISELCNIVGGNLKSKFCDAGMPCSLSTPAFTWGSDFVIETRDMVRYERLSFTYQGQTVFVEALARLAETSPVQPNDTSVEDSPAFDPQEKIDQLLKDTTPEPEPPPPGPTAADSPETVVENPANGPEADNGHPEQAEPEFDLKNLDVLLDIPLEVSFELGRTKQRIDDLLRLGPGSIVELAKLAGEPVDILVNEKLVARGEVVVEKEKYGVRVTEIINRLERLKSLGMPDA